MNRYVIYTDNAPAVDADFEALGTKYLKSNDYNPKFGKVVKMAQNGNHRVSIVLAGQSCIDRMKVDGIEFLGCINGDASCRHNPLDKMSEDDLIKIDLANARGLF